MCWSRQMMGFKAWFMLIYDSGSPCDTCWSFADFSSLQRTAMGWDGGDESEKRDDLDSCWSMTLKIPATLVDLLLTFYRCSELQWDEMGEMRVKNEMTLKSASELMIFVTRKLHIYGSPKRFTGAIEGCSEWHLCARNCTPTAIAHSNTECNLFVEIQILKFSPNW